MQRLLGQDCGASFFDLLNYMTGIANTDSDEFNWHYRHGQIDHHWWDNSQIVKYDFAYQFMYSSSVDSGYHWKWVHDDGGEFSVKFTNIGFDPDNSKIVYGPKKQIDSALAELKGQAFLIDLESFGSDVEHRISRSETLRREVSHTLDREYHSETTGEISGTIPGTGFEAKVTQTFGFKVDDSETKTLGTDSTQAIEDSVICPAWKKSLIYFNKATQQFETPFDIDAVFASGIDMRVPTPTGGHLSKSSVQFNRHGKWYFNDRNNDGGGSHKSFADLTELAQFFNGTDPDYPAMHGILQSMERANGAAWEAYRNILDPEKRRFQISGKRDSTYDDTVTYKVDDVTGQTLEEIEAKHGNVVTLGPLDVTHVLHSVANGPAYWRSTGTSTRVVSEQGELVTAG